MAYENLILERGDDGVAVLTVNRPKALNALNAKTLDEMEAALAEVAKDPAVRALVITGSGEKAFVAGADINEINAVPTPSAGEAMSQRGQEVFFQVERLPKPVIAAVNGFALGGGCELALSCDIRLAADTARLGLPEITLGILPGYGGTQRLPRLVGKGTAKLMIYTGEMVDAQEALRIGLVDRVVPAAELQAAARKLAAQIAGRAPIALGQAKRAVDLGAEVDLDRGCAVEAASFGILCATEDRIEGTRAFLEKRKPVFKGR